MASPTTSAAAGTGEEMIIAHCCPLDKVYPTDSGLPV
jgi:hypothetical protein